MTDVRALFIETLCAYGCDPDDAGYVADELLSLPGITVTEQVTS